MYINIYIYIYNLYMYLLGHFEIVQFLLSVPGKGSSVSLTDYTRDGETPITLMIKYEHIDMLQEFLGEAAVYSLECYSKHGIRNQSYSGMYNALSTIPQYIIKREDD
jgi:hypothetical protein